MMWADEAIRGRWRCVLLIACCAIDSAALSASVVIYPDSVVRSVDPSFFGAGHETYMVGSVLKTPGFEGLLKGSGVRLLRLGGTGNEYYDWEANNYNGCVYFDNGAAITKFDYVYPLDTFLVFCERNAIVPVLSVNFQINDPAKAARLVEFCNGGARTPMGAVRALRGHPAPFSVTDFCIGNEPDVSGQSFNGPPSYRHFGKPFAQWSTTDSAFATAPSYASIVGPYCDSMRARSPIALKIGGISIANKFEWAGEAVKRAGAKFDWIDAHYYPNASFVTDPTQYPAWLRSPDAGGAYAAPLSLWYQALNDTIAKYASGKRFDVNVFEFNCGLILTPDRTWWNYLNTLFIADMWGHLMRIGVPRAAVYGVASGTPGDTSFPYWGIYRLDTLSTRPAALVQDMYAHGFGARLVKSVSDGVNSGYGIESYAALRSADTLAVVVINKRLDSAVTVTVTVAHGGALTSCAIRQMTQDAPLSAPMNGSTGFVDLAAPRLSGTSLTRAFPPASITLMRVTRAGGMTGVDSGERTRSSRTHGIFLCRRRGGGLVGLTSGRRTPIVRLWDVSGRLAGHASAGGAAASGAPATGSLTTAAAVPSRPVAGVYLIDVDAAGVSRVPLVP